jgi:arylsulfatase
MVLADNGASSGTHHYGARPTDPAISEPGPMDSFHTYDTPWADASNTPFYGYKDTCFEGGNATPLIVCWPRGLKVARGSITPQVAHIMDLMPTFVELTGATYPAEYNGLKIPPMEGKSLAPVLKGGVREGHDYLFWEYNHDKAALHDNWKIVALPGGPWRLYNLANDRAEQNDLSRAHPDIFNDLVTPWDAWSKRVGVDKLPGKKASKDN